MFSFVYFFFGWVPRYQEWVGRKIYRAYLITFIPIPILFGVTLLTVHPKNRYDSVWLFSQGFDEETIRLIVAVGTVVLSVVYSFLWLLAGLETKKHFQDWYEELFKR